MQLVLEGIAFTVVVLFAYHYGFKRGYVVANKEQK